MTREGRLLFPCLIHLMWDMSENEGMGVSGEIKRLYSLAEIRRASRSCADLRTLEIDVSSYIQKVENAVHLQAAQFYGLDIIINTKTDYQ